MTAILTLALGIGGNTAMFSVIRAVLLKPLDYPDADQLVRITDGASITRFNEMRRTTRSFSGLAAFVQNEENITLSGGTEPEVLRGARVSANFLTVLEIGPIVGRSFASAEDTANSPLVAMISSELWYRRFSHDPGIAGKTIMLAASPYTIVGVLPPRFQFPVSGIDVWVTRPDEWPAMPAKSRLISPFLNIFGRLKPNVTLQQANAELRLIHHQYAMEHPAMLDTKSKTPTEARLMKDELVTDVRSMLWMLFGAVGFVLLITCANVASLMLARANGRTREFAVRAAIGASQTRLIVHLLTESVLLSLAGGVIGLLIAALSMRAVPLLAPVDLPRAGEIHIDWVVLLFATAISFGTGLLFGIAPSIGASRPDLMTVLRGAGVAAGVRGSKTRSILVIGQIAFSVVLLIGATLMIESVVRLRDVNIGFNPANLLTARVSLPQSRYEAGQKQSTFVTDLVDHISMAPGVQSATASMTIPMGDFAGTPVQDASKPALRLNERPIATVNVVAPNYFHTLQIPIRRGRDFTLQDKKETERVAIIDEAMAKKFWPLYPNGLDPVGQHLFVGGVNPQPARIVGIVATVRQNLENHAWPETVYVSFSQSPQSSVMLAIRSGGDPRQIAPEVRKTLHDMDADLPLSEVQSMNDLMDLQLGRRKTVVDLLGTFAAVALLLALVGLYGTLSYSVSQRVQELGIRAALGAQKGDIQRLVMGQGLLLTGIGIAIGMVASIWLTQTIQQLLFGVRGTDPATFAGIGLLFAMAALLASYLPARRATQIDPVDALRV